MSQFFDFILSIIGHLVPIFIIPPWEAGVRVTFGKYWKEVGPGTHYKIPFVQEFFTTNIKRQIAVCPKQTVTTADGQTLTLSALLTYNIRHPARIWTRIQDFDDSIIALCMQEIHVFIATHDLTDCSYNAIVATVLPVLRKNAFSWGAEVEDLGFGDLAAISAVRLLTDQRSTPLLIG